MSATQVPYTPGLHEVADGVHAYLQPDGGWGWSNAALVVGDDESMLVDTLFDLPLTGAMLDAMAMHTATAPIATLVNTHANGDHCYGNQLVEGADIVTSVATAAEMAAVPPSALAGLTRGGYGPEIDAYLEAAFGPFDFGDIEVPPPTRTFTGQLDLEVAGRRVELVEVGPAHTEGDLLVHLPDQGVVCTGDILFVDGTPIVWAGPIVNWVRACDRILAWQPEVVVPGHGPVTDRQGVEAVRAYLRHVWAEASVRHEAGMGVLDAARDIDLGPFADWGEAERIVLNVNAVYKELDPGHQGPEFAEIFGTMAALAQR